MIMLACGDCGSTDLTIQRVACSAPGKERCSQAVNECSLQMVGKGVLQGWYTPSVGVVCLQLVIVALKGSVILQLYAEEHSLL